jgi:flagellar hook-length control protein FliK
MMNDVASLPLDTPAGAPAAVPIAAGATSAGAFAALLQVAATTGAGLDGLAVDALTIGPDERSGDDADATDGDYSPEAWLELLAVALTGASSAGQSGAQDAGADGTTSGESKRARVDASATFAQATAKAAETAGELQEASIGRASAAALPVPGGEQVAAADSPLRRVLVSDLPSLDTARSKISSGDTGIPAVESPRASRWMPPAAPVAAPIGSPAWADEVATRVVMLARHAEQSATLTMTPRDLGPVEVRISLRESDATVAFVATQSETRQALEAALPRLRDMLASHGLQLTGSSVSGESAHAPPEHSGSGTASRTARESADHDGGAVEPSARWQTQRLLDTYA